MIKKNGTKESFNKEKIITAINKSAERAMITFTEIEHEQVIAKVMDMIQKNNLTEIPIYTMHFTVETALESVNPAVAKSYRDYRNYKQDFVTMLDDVYKSAQSIMYIGDKDNANSDSALVPTQRSLIYNVLNKELYKKFFLNTEELQACKDGYIYVHDMSARRDTMNCCLFDMGYVIKDGFEMGNVWYNEPKTLDVAFDVISDVAISAAACQYGGFTIPRVDTILAPYAQKSYEKYYAEFMEWCDSNYEDKADEYATKKVYRDFEQGFQSWEMRFNTVGSSRGDYPFTSISFGIDTSKWARWQVKLL